MLYWRMMTVRDTYLYEIPICWGQWLRCRVFVECRVSTDLRDVVTTRYSAAMACDLLCHDSPAGRNTSSFQRASTIRSIASQQL